jgi:hypothetical protein
MELKNVNPNSDNVVNPNGDNVVNPIGDNVVVSNLINISFFFF